MTPIDRAKLEFEILDRTLTQVEAGLPEQIEAPKSLEDLAEKLRDYRIPPWMKGAYLVAYRQTLNHGELKQSLALAGINYQYSSHLMKIAKAVAKYPSLKKIMNLTLMRQIAYQPEATQNRIAEFFSKRQWTGESADEIQRLLKVDQD